MSVPLEDYALLGDCETAALVSRDGSLDWLCWPRFDSPACFASLLGGPQNGHWLIAPLGDRVRRQRRYRGDTLILETELQTPEGAATLIEFMPPRDQTSHVVRLVVGRSGQLRMRTELIVRFDYGSLVPWVTRGEAQTLRAVCGPDMVVLRTPVPVRGEDLKSVAEFNVSAGQVVPFVLSYGASHLPAPAAIDPMAALNETESYWTQWSQRSAATGEWCKPVLRSLITLKALTYRPTGGIVAAPTTSLPEQPGGTRNWDYRYCWLRDATFTLLALMNAGYQEEAMQWRGWLLRAVAGDASQVQILYGLRGERRVSEWEIPWLSGYEESRPVRAGNGAAAQLQLDIYGETLDALHHSRASGHHPHDAADWSLQQGLLQHLQQIWEQPDQGIWEMRGGPRHFTYSKIMAWVAFDRSIKAVEQFGLSGPVRQWRALRQRIHDEVCTRGYDSERGTFVQSYGSKELDASLLLMPLVGFLPPTDLRVRGTVEAIERHLMADGLVMRYDTHSGHDGLPPGEGAFLACSFWLADNLVLIGRREDARRLYERLLALRNDVGLLAEEYLPSRKRMLGNFPQALSHIALVNTAHNLFHEQRPAEQRSGASSA